MVRPGGRWPRSRRGHGGSGGGAAYASAIAIDFEGQREYVQFTAKAVVGVAASDGKFLWRYDEPANRMAINCATPIYHDGEVFASSAYDSRRRAGEAEQGAAAASRPTRSISPKRCKTTTAA